jgi:hypothetical protein
MTSHCPNPLAWGMYARYLSICKHGLFARETQVGNRDSKAKDAPQVFRWPERSTELRSTKISDDQARTLREGMEALAGS